MPLIIFCDESLFMLALLFFVILVLSMNKFSMQVALVMMSCVIKISFSYK